MEKDTRRARIGKLACILALILFALPAHASNDVYYVIPVAAVSREMRAAAHQRDFARARRSCDGLQVVLKHGPGRRAAFGAWPRLTHAQILALMRTPAWRCVEGP